MKSIFVLLSYLLHVFSDKHMVYTNYQLRGMFDKEKNKITQYLIDKEYDNIYNGVLQQAIVGKTELRFTILCFNEHEKHNLDIKTSLDDDNLRKIQLYKISNQIISTKIIDKLKNTFVDIEIITEINNTDNPEKCIYYTLVW